MYAFALWCVGSDRIVTWSEGDYGGDSVAIKDQIQNVQQIFATDCGVAALLADGSVVTWGKPNSGGDSAAVQDRLRHAQQTGGTARLVLQSWQMDPWLHGARLSAMVTALQFKSD